MPEEWSAECLSKAASEMDAEVGCVVVSIDFYTSYINVEIPQESIGVRDFTQLLWM